MTVFNRNGDTVQLTNSTTSASLNGEGDVVRVFNAGNQEVFVVTGVGSQSPGNTDAYLAPGQEIFLACGFDHDTIAIDASGGAGTRVLAMRGTAHA